MWNDEEHEHQWVIDDDNEIRCLMCGALDGEEILSEDVNPELLEMEEIDERE
ncbi:hypothetical protein LCGC14_0264890 [marine sediment metagenome]|uniref:Uncharacterized protein n=1 Tax=marine sediment metagenome TaxID=412755 RepID=A0A0F9WLL1_9ZZZZ